MRNPGVRTLAVVATIIAASLLHPATAQAQYVDPGTGSVIIQIVIAGVVGLAAVLRLYWGRITGWVKRSRSEE